MELLNYMIEPVALFFMVAGFFYYLFRNEIKDAFSDDE
jgi:hypothetical protein